MTTFKKHGYKCKVINGLTFGVSEDTGFLLTASSDVAHLTWEKVLPTASNISRLDLQYSFRAEGAKHSEGGEGPLMGLYLKLKQSEHSRKRMYKCIENSKGGETMYIGSRSTDQFGRFYNKSIESGLDVKDVYRLEVEYKKPRSYHLFKKLYKEMRTGGIEALLIRDEVLSWFERRGAVVTELFRRTDPVSVSKVLSSDDKKFKWLRTSVSPTLVDLADRGHLKELAQTLQLTSPQYRQMAMFEMNDLNKPSCGHNLSQGVCIKCGQCFT